MLYCLFIVYYYNVLVIGAYRDGEGAPVVLDSVRAAEEAVFNANEGHEYLTQGINIIKINKLQYLVY